ncbi:MAG: hypothetical protein V4819_03340 [Verrucomicrobiota bacterium]
MEQIALTPRKIASKTHASSRGPFISLPVCPSKKPTTLASSRNHVFTRAVHDRPAQAGEFLGFAIDRHLTSLPA